PASGAWSARLPRRWPKLSIAAKPSSEAMHLSNLTGGTRQVGWVSSANARVLLLSLRKVEDLVAYCAQYEFEDVIASVAGADMATPDALSGVELSRKAYKLVRHLTGSRRLAR